jgi:hypothetical protein
MKWRMMVGAAAVVAAVGALSLPAAAGASTPSGAACDKASWEAKVQGAPAGFGSGAPGGDYLWHDTHGFHLRVTHAAHDLRIYSGTVTSSAPMRMERTRLERGDVARLSANRRAIVFVFANHGYIDGINFHTDCATRLAVSRLHVGGRNLGPRRVYLGATGAHPATVPFVVHRVPAT